MENPSCNCDEVVEKFVVRSKNGKVKEVKAEGMSWFLFFRIARAMPSVISYRWNGPLAGMTALHVACETLRPEYCRVLLARGADPNATDSVTGNTPLHVIARDRFNFVHYSALGSGLAPKLSGDHEVHILEKEVIVVLIRGGARMDVTNSCGETSVSYALSQGRTELVRFLLDASKECTVPGWAEPGQDFVVANSEVSLLDQALKLQRYDIVEALCGMGLRFVQDPTRLPLRWGKLRLPQRIDETLTILGL